MKTLSDWFERIWYRRERRDWLVVILLLPLSLVFYCLTTLRRYFLKQKQAHLSVPVIVVGNISVGGTGKTPLLCALAQALTQRGLRVGIISRGYGGDYFESVCMVAVDDAASRVGDEPLLIARATQCPVVIGRDRFLAAQHLLTHQSVDVILSDDGLQHYALPRNVEIVVLDAERGIGNSFCLPAGPLREPASRLQSADFIVVNGQPTPCNILPNIKNTLSVQLQPQCWVSVGSGGVFPLEAVDKKTTVHAVAGIGNPLRFFATLKNMGYTVIEHAFPDHHVFIEKDCLFNDEFSVLMTEKDAVKCADFAKENWYALRVAMSLPEAWVDAVWQTASSKFQKNKVIG